MKKVFLKTMIASAVLSVASVSFADTTMVAAVDMAMKNSPDVGIVAAQKRASDYAVDQARGGYYPSVDVAFGYGFDKSKTDTFSTEDYWRRGEASLSIRQMLFDNSATYNEVKRNEAKLLADTYSVEGTSEQIALATVKAYLDVMRAREEVALTKENLETHEKTYEQIADRAESGVGSRSDQDQAEARLALSQANLVAAEANLKDAEIAYMRYTGEYPDALVEPAEVNPELIPATLEDATKKAKDNNPMLKLAKADIEEAKAQYGAAKSAMGPNIFLEAGVDHLRDAGGTAGDDDTTYAMLRMRWNLYRGGSDQARARSMKELSNQAVETMKRTMVQLDQSVALSWNALTSVSARLPSLQQHAESSRLTRDAYVDQFDIGKRTLIDLLDTENEYYTSSVSYINAQYLEMYARYRLLADMGMLLDTLNVEKREEALVQAN